MAELGRGGMADVYLAARTRAHARRSSGSEEDLVVIKRLRADLAEDADLLTMLMDEARLTARLCHPNVVRLLDAGAAGDEVFLAMEFLDGQPLHRVERRIDFDESNAVLPLRLLVLCDVLAGLHHAHELVDERGESAGLVHRDVNPQNVFVTYDGHGKLLDFGVAKITGKASQTQAGVIKGKLRYMSPEQVLGGHVDKRSDVFAVGVMLFQTLTRRRYWQDLDDLDILRALTDGEVASSPREVRTDVPRELDAICRRALARKPEGRFASAGEMREALLAYLSTHEEAELRARLAAFVSGRFAEERKRTRDLIEADRATRGGREDETFSRALSRSIQAILSTSRTATPRSNAPVAESSASIPAVMTSLATLEAARASRRQYEGGAFALAEVLEPPSDPSPNALDASPGARSRRTRRERAWAPRAVAALMVAGSLAAAAAITMAPTPGHVDLFHPAASPAAPRLVVVEPDVQELRTPLRERVPVTREAPAPRRARPHVTPRTNAARDSASAPTPSDRDAL